MEGFLHKGAIGIMCNDCNFAVNQLRFLNFIALVSITVNIVGWNPCHRHSLGSSIIFRASGLNRGLGATSEDADLMPPLHDQSACDICPL